MELHEAYNLTVQKIIELRDSGMEISTKYPFLTANENHSADYRFDRILPKELWNNVSFLSISKDQMQQILNVKNYLFGFGIYFDNGVFIASEKPTLDWLLDGSFLVMDY
jgi:hypothetical protein